MLTISFGLVQAKDKLLTTSFAPCLVFSRVVHLRMDYARTNVFIKQLSHPCQLAIAITPRQIYSSLAYPSYIIPANILTSADAQQGLWQMAMCKNM